MSKDRLYLYDTTLRDGAQTTGVDFSIADKRRIMAVLDDLGVDYIEGGYPGSNPTDTDLFARAPNLKSARFTAFGMTKRAGRSVSNDPGLQAILQSSADSICLVAKSWDYHVRVALGISNEENVDNVVQSVKAILATNREAMIDCEHFFDGYKGNRDYALAVAKTAFDSGARWIVLCDTNGGTLPHEIERIVADVARHVPGSHLGIHTHNDTENAVANTLMAVRAGCRQIQGTLNGLGERCGNANITSIIPTLLLKSEFANAFEPKPEHITLPADELASYTGLYKANLVHARVVPKGDVLELTLMDLGGFPDENSPPGPVEPPFEAAFFAPDRIIGTTGLGEGARAEFIRNDDGSLRFLRFSGRMFAYNPVE